MPEHYHSLLHEIKNVSFLAEGNHETINELYETLLNVRKKLQSVARKENGIILKPTGKSSDVNRKFQKGTYITCQIPKRERSNGQEELV